MQQRISGAAPPLAERLPPHAFFIVSAVFHYLGPSFAVLLFAQVEPLGVAWLRIASAALVFALWRRPWRVLRDADRRTLLLIVGLGASLAAMNACFYLAIDRLPLATVASIEFVAMIAVALAGVRSLRNFAALAVTLVGVYALIGVRGGRQPARPASSRCSTPRSSRSISCSAMPSRGPAGRAASTGSARRCCVALVFAAPIGFRDAAPAFFSPALLLAGIGVGISSSVIPYVCDQLAMARLPRATFALMLALLPATAAIVGAIVLRQIPSPVELPASRWSAIGIAIHKPAGERIRRAPPQRDPLLEMHHEGGGEERREEIDDRNREEARR